MTELRKTESAIFDTFLNLKSKQRYAKWLRNLSHENGLSAYKKERMSILIMLNNYRNRLKELQEYLVIVKIQDEEPLPF